MLHPGSTFLLCNNLLLRKGSPCRKPIQIVAPPAVKSTSASLYRSSFSLPRRFVWCSRLFFLRSNKNVLAHRDLRPRNLCKTQGQNCIEATRPRNTQTVL